MCIDVCVYVYVYIYMYVYVKASGRATNWLVRDLKYLASIIACPCDDVSLELQCMCLELEGIR